MQAIHKWQNVDINAKLHCREQPCILTVTQPLSKTGKIVKRTVRLRLTKESELTYILNLEYREIFRAETGDEKGLAVEHHCNVLSISRDLKMAIDSENACFVNVRFEIPDIRFCCIDACCSSIDT